MPRGWDGGSEKRKCGEQRVANEQNLIPFTSDQDREEAKKNGRNGGKASGAARRRKRSMREAAEYYLSLPVMDQKAINRFEKDGIEVGDIDNQMAVIVGLTKSAMKGDSRAAKLIMEMLGENPKEEPNDQQIQQHNALIEAIRNMK